MCTHLIRSHVKIQSMNFNAEDTVNELESEAANMALGASQLSPAGLPPVSVKLAREKVVVVNARPGGHSG